VRNVQHLLAVRTRSQVEIVIPRVVAHCVAVAHDPSYDAGQIRDLPTDHAEGRVHVVAVQEVEHRAGPVPVRAVVEGQRDRARPDEMARVRAADHVLRDDSV